MRFTAKEGNGIRAGIARLQLVRALWVILCSSPAFMAHSAESGEVQQPATRDFRSLDREIQVLKREVLELNRDLRLLEEEVLYPDNRQLVVFIGPSKPAPDDAQRWCCSLVRVNQPPMMAGSWWCSLVRQYQQPRKAGHLWGLTYSRRPSSSN